MLNYVGNVNIYFYYGAMDTAVDAAVANDVDAVAVEAVNLVWML